MASTYGRQFEDSEGTCFCSVILSYGRANYLILFRFPYVTVVFLKQQFGCRGE